MVHLSWTIFFGTNHYYYFHLRIGAFHCAKLKKKFLQQIQSYEDAPLLGPKWSICPKENFFETNVNINFIYLLVTFIVQNFKKFLKWSQSYEDMPFLGPKWPIWPNKIFFQKNLLISLVPFMSIIIPKIKFRYLSINEILTIKEYWKLLLL